MITSSIGKIFLNAYNERYGTHYDAKTFFVEKYCPIFYGFEKYFFWPVNSPFVQGLRKGVSPTEYEIVERIKKAVQKIEESEADASIAIGYSSLNILSTTSGQVSNIKLGTTADDVYCSWIGSGLGVGVAGATILFFNSNILLDIFEGWKYYRQILNTVPYIKSNQIETWNGLWISHKYSNMFIADNPIVGLPDISSNQSKELSYKTISWTKVLVEIAKTYQDCDLMSYVYKIGGKDPNTTIGFIPFSLQQIRKPIELYQKLFGMDSAKKAEPLWGTAFGFSEACKVGVIGIKAMQPKGLKDYIVKGESPKSPQSEEQVIIFNTYIIWIMAMLNNEDLWVKAHDFAIELQNYAQCGDKGRTINSNRVNNVLGTTNKSTFIKSLVDVVADANNKDKIEELARIVNAMPPDNVSYFLTLIRFHYAEINNTKKL